MHIGGFGHVPAASQHPLCSTELPRRFPKTIRPILSELRGSYAGLCTKIASKADQSGQLSPCPWLTNHFLAASAS